jgi:hypothetical protein
MVVLIVAINGCFRNNQVTEMRNITDLKARIWETLRCYNSINQGSFQKLLLLRCEERLSIA